ncbi:MAG TPA: hypothetical protein VK638_48780 [Edaphobacter sp.]|nr:hypothetical protein [Edaphobacter sp.]
MWWIFPVGRNERGFRRVEGSSQGCAAMVKELFYVAADESMMAAKIAVVDYAVTRDGSAFWECT